MIPDMVRVGPVWYRVVRRNGLTHKGKPRFGLWDPIAEEILIEASLRGSLAYSVFLHELIHAIDYDRGLELTERQTDQIANGLCMVFWEGEGDDDGAEDSESGEGVGAAGGVPEAEAEPGISRHDEAAE